MSLCYHCFQEKGMAVVCPFCDYDPTGAEEKFPLAMKPGSILNGRYTVGRVLGQGGFGITYIAQDYGSKERVAIKEYLPEEFATRDSGGCSVQVFSGSRRENFEYGKKQFLEEAETLASFIGEEQIVRIYSYFEENNTAYFVMEYIGGLSLDKYMAKRGGALSVDEANRLLLPLMDGLGAVHARGIIHRDIAPDNILITPAGTAKLIDFGAARYSTGEKSKSLDVILKHGFAPAEQYMRRGRQGPFTDVYAMAATYYYAITGKIPPDAVERMQTDTLLLPRSLGVKISAEGEDVLLKALEVNAQDRYQQMSEFHRDLETENRTESQQKQKNRNRAERTEKERKEKERAEKERREREIREKEEKRERERQERLAREKAEREERERKARQEKEKAERLKIEQNERRVKEKQSKSGNQKPGLIGFVILVLIAVMVFRQMGSNRNSTPTSNPAATAMVELPGVVNGEYTLEDLYPELKASYGGYQIPKPDGSQRLTKVIMNTSPLEIAVCSEPEYDATGNMTGIRTYFDGVKSYEMYYYLDERKTDQLGRLISTSLNDYKCEYKYAEDGNSYTWIMSSDSDGNPYETKVYLKDRQITDYVKRDQWEGYRRYENCEYNEDGFPAHIVYSETENVYQNETRVKETFFNYYYESFKDQSLKTIKRQADNSDVYIPILEFDEHGYLTQYVSQLELSPCTLTYEYESIE